MSQIAPHQTSPATPRAGFGAYAWFVGMVASWIAFAVLAVASPETLNDLWGWVRGVPLAAEILLWALMLPWMLALAIWESSWEEWLRILLVVSVAGAWSLVSIPRARGGQPAGRQHWEIRPGQPNDDALTRKGLRHVQG